MKFHSKDLYFHIFKAIWTKQARFYESADGLRLYFRRLPKKSKKLISQICEPGKNEGVANTTTTWRAQQEARKSLP